MFVAPLVLAASAINAGCATLFTPELRESVETVPASQRVAVHIWLINSPIDPLHLGQLGRLASALEEAGFSTHYQHFPGAESLIDAIETERAAPGITIMLVGWSGGSLTAWDAASALDEQGQRVDAVVYLDSNWIKTRINERGHPDNVDHLLLVYRANNPVPEGLPTARVARIPTGNHLAIPTRPGTIEAIIDLALQLSRF